MEGWLYLISSNTIIGLQFYRKRYFVLQHHLLKTFKSIPLSIHDQDFISSATIDSCIGVLDNGIERIQRRALFIFTVFNSSNRGDQLKLGATSAEEAARWIRSLKDAALKEDQNHVAADCSLSQTWPLTVRSHCSSKLQNSIDWTTWTIKAKDAMACDVVTQSRWTIFDYQKGLRLFKVTKDGGFHGNWNKHPSIMAVGVIDASSEVIFRTLMSLGPSRSEWDFCFDKGNVIEHLDGHNDIVHKLLHRDWLPWGMNPRDLLLQRHWRKDDDGTHVILYQSVTHHKCPKEKGSVRAYLKCGGFVVSPMNEGRQSVVKHMLAIDWKSWISCFRSYSSRCITIRMVETLAALREMFRAKAEVESIPGFSLRRSGEELKLDESEEDEEEFSKTPSEYGSLIALSEATTEFFDVFEPSNFDLLEDGWSSDFTADIYSQGNRHPNYLSTAVFARKLHDFAAPKRDYMADLHEIERADELTCNYGFTLPKDPSGNLHCSWTTADPSEFLIRGKTYDVDRKKIKAEGTLMQMVAADWLKSNKREDDLAGRPSSVVQKYAARNSPEFFFIINIQFPGVTTHNLAFYYMMNTPVEDVPLLDKFIKGDDAYRNSRFKLIPYICQGPWIVKQTVVKKPTLLGQALKVTYYRGKNYLELGVDIGSSRLARHMAGLVLGYLNNAVTDLAFLIQGNTSEELPEIVLGTCRLNRLDPSKTVPVKR